MKALLYFLTAVSTALQAWFAISDGVWGPPANFLEYLALLGSAVLFAAAEVEPRKPRLSWFIAIVGLGLLWSWYAPALMSTFYSVVTDLPLAGHLAKYRLLGLIPSAFLVTTSMCAWKQWRPAS